MATDMTGWFRWADGWHFRRSEDGSVEIMHLVAEDPHLGHDVRVSIPPQDWIGIVAAMTGGESDSATYQALVHLHRMST